MSSLTASLPITPISARRVIPGISRAFRAAPVAVQPLPLRPASATAASVPIPAAPSASPRPSAASSGLNRSEEHTSELQSLAYLVCRLLLEKKKKIVEYNLSSKKHWPAPLCHQC